MNQPKIIWENKEMLVVEKPAGLCVHQDLKQSHNYTLVDWLVKKYPQIQKEDWEYKYRPGIVHRLDKDTSGLLMIAKTRRTFENLKSQIKLRKVGKWYRALVLGKVEPKKDVIYASVGRKLADRKKMSSFSGKPAKTSYQVINYYCSSLSRTKKTSRLANAYAKNDILPAMKSHDYMVRGGVSFSARRGNDAFIPALKSGVFRCGNKLIFSLLDIKIATGRTHQIRVHMKSRGYPVVGDKLYAKGRDKKIWQKVGAERQFLHAYRLEFIDPLTRKKQDIKIKLAIDLSKILKKLSTMGGNKKVG